MSGIGKKRSDAVLSDFVASLEEQHCGPAHACPYLPGREARICGFVAESLSASLYHELMDLVFRRSGRLFYRPACAGCRECVPIRVSVAAFTPSRSQRRVSRRNADVSVEVGRPMPTDEKHALFRRYLAGQHDGSMSGERSSFEQFLYAPAVDTLEFEYRLGRRLVGVGLADVCVRSLSSVYFYFDPEMRRRSLGVYSALQEIEYCRREGIPHYYLGYYVQDSGAMNYKARFRPYELLRADGGWHRSDLPERLQDPGEGGN